MQKFQAIEWVPSESTVRLLEQTLLPNETVFIDCSTVDQLIDAIVRLAVRGAPALGATGALGVVVAMDQGTRENWDESRLQLEVDRIRNARPTAVNLAWGVDQVRPLMAHGRDAVLAAALAVVADDTAANRELSRHGADWILARTGDRKVRVLTHCNTGGLATTSWGTALGIVRELHERDRLEIVYADETRPLLQGSRLTAWELEQEGIDYRVQVDGAAASTILGGRVDVAIIGADRIARNGDTANKIGSLGVALACADAGIPFMVAAPASTVDLDTHSGTDITIELRGDAEVLEVGSTRMAPANARAFNPAFDVTPHRLINAIVTEVGVIDPRTEPDVSRITQQEIAR